jgi:hypothetical protein
MSSTEAEPEELLSREWVLLDGEDPLSLHRDDPEHWVAVYSELVDSTTRMLDAARERVAAYEADGNTDVTMDEREIEVLAVKTQFFGTRLRWWVMRGRELWER